MMSPDVSCWFVSISIQTEMCLYLFFFLNKGKKKFLWQTRLNSYCMWSWLRYSDPRTLIFKKCQLFIMLFLASWLFISRTVAILSLHCGNDLHLSVALLLYKNLHDSDRDLSVGTSSWVGQVCGYYKRLSRRGGNQSEVRKISKHIEP